MKKKKMVTNIVIFISIADMFIIIYLFIRIFSTNTSHICINIIIVDAIIIMIKLDLLTCKNIFLYIQMHSGKWVRKAK